MSKALLYKNKPLFGLDIGFSSLKVMQLERASKNKVLVTGYGVTKFDKKIINDGVIEDPIQLAKVTQNFFRNGIVGEINTDRAAIAIPASRVYNRAVTLPKLSKKDLQSAINSEVDQYIPMPSDELYIDHEILSERSDGTDILIVASPRKIVDSYMDFAHLVGFEVASIETTIAADGRLFFEAEDNDIPTVLIDFGSISSDITIYDKSLVVTGTVPGGGDTFTDLIAKKLGVSEREADIIKTKYGLSLSKKQKEINESLEPILAQIIKEVRRVMRYYEERSEQGKKIGQIVVLGGGANMPGLSDYMTSALRLPVRLCDPWQVLTFGKLQPPNSALKSMYITAAGLALMDPRKVYEA
ncbi:MAG: type IV pilus assembly protein PilM [Candidatus Saccharibacteria bacterium]|nr:type IV pilus assembly protein PilM [Candidatus Saccharibacteria bacterium]